IFCAKDRLPNPSCELHVVVLEHDHVIQAHTMIMPAADPHRPFFREPEVGGSLAGVDDSGVGTGNLVHQPARGGGNAAHALHAVEHQAFRSQNRARRAFYAESDIAAPDGGAIFECDLNQKPEIEMGEYPPGEKDSGKNTILL